MSSISKLHSCTHENASNKVIDEVIARLIGINLYKRGIKRPVNDLIEDCEKSLLRLKNHNSNIVNVSKERKLNTINKDFQYNDSIDLCVEIEAERKKYIVIEFDTMRADQIAKKAVSRITNICPNQLIYVSFCYPGTSTMNSNEVKKYMEYINDLCKIVGVSNYYSIVPNDSN